MNSRREFIKKAAFLSGALGLPSVIPMSIQKAMAIEADPGSTFYDAEHVVFLMQENRSFDHMFGKMRGVRGFNDPRVKTLPSTNKVWLQSDGKGNTYAPFHVDIQKTKITWQGGLPHSWSDQVAARNNGKYDRWVPVKSLMSLGYYQREDISFYYALADAFTVCDHYFCSSLTGTTPNRLFFWTGNVRPRQDANSMPVVNNSQAESRDNTFVDWQTFPELLEDHGVSWKVYQNELWTAELKGEEVDDWCGNYGDNALEYIKRHRVKLSAYFRKNGDHTSQPALSAEEVLAKYEKLSQREKNLIDKAFSTNIDNPDYLKLAPFQYRNDAGEQETLSIPQEDIFAAFRKDVDSGNLPAVSWLVAPQRFSDHTSSPLYGTWYVAEAMDILTKNPEVWKKTIFVLTYDENDGYFDHIPPFVVPNPDKPLSGKVSGGLETRADYEFRKDSPIGLGYRVPMIVASPWSKGGYVNSQVFDHTSALQFLEHFLSRKTGKKLKSDNISEWRRAVCGNLTSVFRPYTRERLSPLMVPEKDRVFTDIQKARSKPDQLVPNPLSTADLDKINAHLPFHPSASPYAPVQEKGVRPACALPYQLHAESELTADRTEVVLHFEAGKTRFGDKLEALGAAFNGYVLGSYAGEQGHARAYAVKAGDKITDHWEVAAFEREIYQLKINGPNGFFRQFEGTKNDPALTVSCQYEQRGILKKFTGNLVVKLENKEPKAVIAWLKDQSYGAKSRRIVIPSQRVKTIVLNLKKNSGWYDFSLQVDGNAPFLKHYAGHVETGEDSISDPLMGGMIS